MTTSRTSGRVRCVLISLGLSFAAAPLGAATCYIDLSNNRMTFRGIGAASVWMGELSDAVMDKAYTSNGGCVGLTVNRMRIDPYRSWTTELNNAKKASARGAIIMATPWTPPPSMKTNASSIHGSLSAGSYADWASYLQEHATYLANNGVALFATSVQNEPDYDPDYESCTYTTAQMLDFVKNHAGGVSTRLIAAEAFGFNKAYSDAILNDPTARNHIEIVGGHIYGGGLASYPLAATYGKEVWMTEHLNTDTTITGQMQTAKEILDCFAVANFNVYNWWYVKRVYGPIDDDGNRTKRGCVMAQFARWVRPGYIRVATSYNPGTNVYAATFKSGAKVVIVAVNTGTASASQTFAITGGTVPSSVQPYRTSASQDLATLPTVSVTGGSFTSSLPGQSITTFVSP
jgi:glucuronoarabinoxylan endo-1,4-beta-xylanase